MILKLIQKLLFFFEYFVNNSYLSLFEREKFSNDMHSSPDLNSFNDRVAIVMQGPIIIKDNFTFETLSLYKKRYPKVLLVLSTWDDYLEKDLKKFTDIGIEVLKNKKPKYYGFSNINLQIESSRKGINFAKNKKIKYCLKTRTDQRIYRHDFILFFLSLINLFQIDNHSFVKNRLLSVSLNTFKYRLYGVTDMLMFGHIDDMLLYWNVEFDERKLESINFGSTIQEWSKARTCEVYLSTEYLIKIGHKPLYTLEDSWYIYSKYFCIVDRSSIDLFWLKYNRTNEKRRYNNKNRALDEEFTFSDWINCLNNLIMYKSDDELLLKKQNMSKII
jgi:hypothetical protein